MLCFCPKADMASVIMPAYNSGQWIEKSIQSVIGQTYTNWELLVIDDGSIDNTIEIIEQFSLEDSRIKLLKNQFGKGAAGARNTGIVQSIGKYIAFLDSDDLWLPEKLQTQIQFMVNNGASLCHSYYEMFDLKGNSKVVGSRPVVGIKDMMKSCEVGCLTVMIDKVSLGKDLCFPESPKEDYALWLSLLRKGFVFKCCPHVLARYRKGHSSISANKIDEIRKQYYVLRTQSGSGVLASGYYLFTYVIKGLRKHWFE